MLSVVNGAERPGPILSRAWPMPVFSRNVGGRYVHGQRLYRENNKAFVMDDDGQGVLYSLSADRSMAIPLDEDLAPWRQKAFTAFPEAKVSGAVTVPDEALQQLKALGYMEQLFKESVLQLRCIQNRVYPRWYCPSSHLGERRPHDPLWWHR